MPQRSHSPAHRGGRNSSHRSGNQGRGQQSTYVDRDGDINMSTSGAGRGRGRGRGPNHYRDPHTPQTNGYSNAFKDSHRYNANQSTAQRGAFRAAGEGNTYRGSRGPSRFEKRHDRSTGGLDQILIRGLRQSRVATDPDGGQAALISWLTRKASPPHGEAVKIIKPRRNGDDLIISVRPEDTVKFTRLNNYQFAGTNIIVEIQQNGQPSTNGAPSSLETTEVKDLLFGILAHRYIPETKYLDLSGLVEDPLVVNTGLLDNKNRISKLFPALMCVCNEAYDNEAARSEAIDSISLANNNLLYLDSVYSLADTFPNLKNLDISNNQFKNIHTLDKWQSKLRQLEHIIVHGNPLAHDQNLMSSLMSRYPKLRRVDTNNQGQAHQNARPVANGSIQLPIAQPSFQDEADIAQNFILQFFPRYDRNRYSLLNDYYDANSSFSLSVNNQAPHDPNVVPPSWGEYTKISRNLKRVNHTKPRTNRLYEGRAIIEPLWKSLPATRHPDLKMEFEKWCIECHPVPGVPQIGTPEGVGGLLVTVHGECDDLASHQKFSFDRTFVLGPGQAFPGVRVVSDMLVLRAYGGCESFRPNMAIPAPQTLATPQAFPVPHAHPVPQITPAPQAVQQNTQVPSSQNPFLPGSSVPDLSQLNYNPLISQPAPITSVQINLPESLNLPENFGVRTQDKTEEQIMKETMAMELTMRTRMTIKYCAMCLEETGFDLEEAYKAFEGAKGSLPEEAFLPHI